MRLMYSCGVSFISGHPFLDIDVFLSVPTQIPAWSVAHVGKKRPDALIVFRFSSLVVDFPVLLMDDIKRLDDYLCKWVAVVRNSITNHAIIARVHHPQHGHEDDGGSERDAFHQFHQAR